MNKIEDNIFQIELDIYNIDIVVAVGTKAFERLNELYTPIDEEYERLKEPAEDTPACTWERMKDRLGNRAILVWFQDASALHNPSYSSHEASHAAMYVWHHIGAKVDLDNQEPFSYLIGNITNKFAIIFKENYSNETS